MEESKEPRVAIIGGGISGLAAAKQLKWLNPTVYEATDSIGGVWRHCSYSSTRLQTPRMDYEFSDYPWKDRNDTTFPTHTEILEYLDGYAKHFDLYRHIKFNTRVVEIKFIGDPAKAGFTELWGDHGRPLTDCPVWEVGVVTGESQDVQVPFSLLIVGLFTSIDACIAEFEDYFAVVYVRFRGDVYRKIRRCAEDACVSSRQSAGSFQRHGDAFVGLL
jgi:hypothetical protein